jgi:hypothetical protein
MEHTEALCHYRFRGRVSTFGPTHTLRRWARRGTYTMYGHWSMPYGTSVMGHIVILLSSTVTLQRLIPLPSSTAVQRKMTNPMQAKSAGTLIIC